MTNYSRTTLRELKKRYLNILKKCLLANLMAFSFVLPSMAETVTNPATNEELLEALLDPTKRVMITIPTLQYEINLNGKKMTLPVTSELAGGKLNANSHSVKFTGTGLFEGNKIETKDARSTGGAVYMQKGMTFENVDFKNNEVKNTNNIADGGAIFNALGTLTITGHANFIGNKVNGKEGHGGALYNSGGILNLNSVTFEKNKAESETTFAWGGAIYTTGVNAKINITGHSVFKENSVKGYSYSAGGAIYIVQGEMTLGSATFEKNKAESLNKNVSGGVISNHANLTFTGDAIFKNNEATSKTGTLGIAIYSEKNVTLKNAKFIENKSVQDKNTGGIVYTSKGNFTADYLLFKDNLISSNDEYAQSAGLFVNGGEATIKSADFIGNKVYSATSVENYWANGGALLASNGITTFTSTVLLKNNIAEALGFGGGKGGGISISENAILNFDGLVSVISNKAISKKGNAWGGGLFNQGTLNFNSDFLFASNQSKSGKDIYYEGRNNTASININGNIGTVGTIEGGIAGAPKTDTEFIPQINKSGAGLLVLGDNSENHEYQGTFTQTAGTTIANSERFFSHELAQNTINGGELKTHGAEIAYKAVVGQNVDDTGAILSAGKVMHYTTKPEMEVNAETLANITFAGEDMGATIGVGTYNKAEQEKEIALVGDRLVEYVDDKGTEDTSDDEMVRYQATDKLFTIDTLASGERTMFKVTGALPNEKGNKIAFANGIVEVGDIQTLADYEFNSSTLKTPRDFEFKGKVTVNNLELSDGLGNLKMKELKVVKDSDLDIKNTKITTDLFTLDGENNVKVSVHSLSDYGQILAKETVSKESGTLTMNLVGAPQEGVYKVFEQDTDLKLATTHEFFDIADLENGSYKIARKKADELAEKFGLNEEETRAVSAVIGGNSENEAFQKVQSEIMETLKSGNKGKAKKALGAVGAKEQPVEQSVASEHLVALQNVVQAELHGTTVGHSGGDTEPRAKVYIKGLYDRTKSSMGEGFRARSKGAVLGVQSEVTEDLTLGVGYATSQTTAKEDLRRTEVDTNTGFISAHYQPNAWWVSGLATFSRGEYEEEKQILSSMGKASYNVDSWGAQVMTGYDIKLENAIITPEVGLRYLSVKQEGYTDTLGTTVSGTRSDYLTALVGVKGTWDMGAIRPTAGVTVGYDIISDDVSALNTLANGASYTVNGEALDRLSTGVSLGVEADIGERTTLKLEYSGTFRKEYVDHSGMLKLEMKF